MEGVAGGRQVRLCVGLLSHPALSVQSKQIPFPLFWSEGNFLSQFQKPRLWMQAELLEAGTSSFLLYQRQSLDRSPDLSGLISLSAKWTSKRSSPSGCTELTLFHEKPKSECKPPQQIIASVFKQLMGCRKTEPLRSPSSTSNKSGLIPLPTLSESVKCWRRLAADKRRNEAAQSLIQRWRHSPGGPVRGSRSVTTFPKYPLVNPRQKLVTMVVAAANMTGFQDHHSAPRPPSLYPLQEARKLPCKIDISHLHAEQLALHSPRTLPWSPWGGLRVPRGPARRLQSD